MSLYKCYALFQCEVYTFKKRINDTIQQIQLISFDKILNYFSHIEMHGTYMLRTSHNEARCDVLWQQALTHAFREWCISGMVYSLDNLIFPIISSLKVGFLPL